MLKALGSLTITACLFAAPTDKDRREAAQRLTNTTAVGSEALSGGDKGIPKDLLDKAHCAVIVPSVKKAAFILGGQFGRGFMTCRETGGVGWSAPAAITMEGGSFGLQIGGSETDVLLLVMNERGADNLMQSKFTLGGEGEVAAGPVGREASAQTDAKLSAEILSWSYSKGAFAGIALKGSTLRADPGQNDVLYGKELQTREVVMGKTIPTPEGKELISKLSRQ